MPPMMEAGEFGSAGYRDYAPVSAMTDGLSESGAFAQTGPVVVVNEASRKPYLGGYRDGRTEKTYHHAYTETEDARVKPSKWAHVAPGSRIEREVQTSTAVTRSIQSKREGCAQTERRDLHHDGRRDKMAIPRPYVTSEEIQRAKEENAVRIQCAIRCALARRAAMRLEEERAAYKGQLAAEEAEQERRAQEAEAEAARRRANPRTAADFAALFDEVEEWRLSECARVEEGIAEEVRALEATPLPPFFTLAGPKAHAQRKKDLEACDAKRRAALAAVAMREQALVAAIERQRTAAGRANAVARTEAQLEGMAAPQAWAVTQSRGLGGTGTLGRVETVQVTTPFATRAAQLKALYEALLLPCPGPGMESSSARMDLLLHVKYTVKEFDTALTRELAQLIDREVDLLERGRPASSLVGLRQRIRSLFLTFAQTPQFNPAAAPYSKVPGGPLGVLGPDVNLTGTRGEGALGHTAGTSCTAVRGGAGGNRVRHPYAGTSRDPRLLLVPSFMRPTLKG